MTELTPSMQASEQRARWAWFLAVGVTLVLLGLAASGAVAVLELSSFLVFGPLLLASSFIQLLAAFLSEKGRDLLLHGAAAGLEMILGFFIWAHPLRGVVTLTTWIAIFLIAIGLARLARSHVTRLGGRGWTAMAGVIAVVLGICVWTELPIAGMWFVGLCIGVDFICHGVSWSALALAERQRS
jgi:uncharacterized membrane protein HdeD (DUF308 family)